MTILNCTEVSFFKKYLHKVVFTLKYLVKYLQYLEIEMIDLINNYKRLNLTLMNYDIDTFSLYFLILNFPLSYFHHLFSFELLILASHLTSLALFGTIFFVDDFRFEIITNID